MSEVTLFACEIPETNPRRVRGRESVVSKQASEPRGAEPLMSPKRIFHQINNVLQNSVMFSCCTLVNGYSCFMSRGDNIRKRILLRKTLILKSRTLQMSNKQGRESKECECISHYPPISLPLSNAPNPQSVIVCQSMGGFSWPLKCGLTRRRRRTRRSDNCGIQVQ